LDQKSSNNFQIKMNSKLTRHLRRRGGGWGGQKTTKATA
jgi:hypothetical protein